MTFPSAIYISLSANSDFERCYEVLKWCTFTYSGTHLLYPPNDFMVKAKKRRELQFTYNPVVTSTSSQSILCLTTHPLNIQCYSVRVFIDEKSRKHSERERNSNIHVDYLIYNGLFDVMQVCRDLQMLKKQFFDRGRLKKSVIVFDLDETIIDEHYNLVCKNVDNTVNASRAIFDLVVLWSHGNAKHVKRALKTRNLHFDMVLTRGATQTHCSNKGLGYVLKCLNENFDVGYISHSCLVDDTMENFKNDYNIFILVPRKISHADMRAYYDWAFTKLLRLKGQIKMISEVEVIQSQFPSLILQRD